MFDFFPARFLLVSNEKPSIYNANRKYQVYRFSWKEMQKQIQVIHTVR